MILLNIILLAAIITTLKLVIYKGQSLLKVWMMIVLFIILTLDPVLSAILLGVILAVIIVTISIAWEADKLSMINEELFSKILKFLNTSL